MTYVFDTTWAPFFVREYTISKRRDISTQTYLTGVKNNIDKSIIVSSAYGSLAMSVFFMF